MQTDVEDVSHGRLWRQLIRSLVQDVPSPVAMRSAADDLTAGNEAELDFLIRDNLFDKRVGLQTTAQLTAEGAPPVDLPVEESIAESGVYSVRFTPDADGAHQIKLTAKDEAGEPVGEFEQTVEVRRDLREFRDAAYAPAFLKAAARQSHGAFFELDRLNEVARAIPRTATDDTRFEVVHLWRFPGFFALAALLFGVEWFLRRRYGQP
jgi:hypothetical protein